MILTCPQCQSNYNLDPAKLGAEGKTVRCVSCHHTWFQTPVADEPAKKDEAVFNQILSEVGGETPAAEAAEPVADNREPAARSDIPAAGIITHNPLGVGAAAFGGLVFCLCLSLTLAFLFLAQKPLVRQWPPMALFYKTLGFHLKAPGEGLRLSEIVAEQRIDKQDIMLVIEGKITNMSEHQIAYPPLSVALKNGQGVSIKDWKLEPGVIKLASGETVPVMLQLTGAPPEGASIEVRVQGE
jgi:predicted Zn finger-like uncharacterized protein